MSRSSSKREQALDACDKVINGIEDSSIGVQASLLLCMKIARLVNDVDGMVWLQYEYGGYPRDNTGHIVSSAWNIGAKHGRSYRYKINDNKYGLRIFTELCGELEATIDSNKGAINNYSTQGFSAEGQYALLATDKMTDRINAATVRTVNNIKVAENHLSILKAQYYDYAVKWQIELNFGNTAKNIFDEYQERVDKYFSSLSVQTMQKLNAIEDMMEDSNPERYSQVLTSCRRLWASTADELFNEVLPEFKGDKFKTKSGKEIVITAGHVNNRLSAVIETLQSKASSNTLVGSEISYLIDWMDQINGQQNAGVHEDVTREMASKCIIQTYIALGDILSLRENVKKNSIQNATVNQ